MVHFQRVNGTLHAWDRIQNSRFSLRLLGASRLKSLNKNRSKLLHFRPMAEDRSVGNFRSSANGRAPEHRGTERRGTSDPRPMAEDRNVGELRIQVYTSVPRCTQLYTGVHRCTQVSTGVHRCPQVYTGVHRCTPVYTLGSHSVFRNGCWARKIKSIFILFFMIKMRSLRFLREPLVNLDKKSGFKMVATMLIQDVYYGIRFFGGT